MKLQPTVFREIDPRYNCNRYDEDEARSARDAQEKSRAALQRYLFYCNRYMNHLQSLKFENKLYTTVKVSAGADPTTSEFTTKTAL
jgi:hypothetical protein